MTAQLNEQFLVCFFFYLFWVCSGLSLNAQCPEISNSASGQVCVGDTISFEVVNASVDSISWDFNSGDLYNEFTMSPTLANFSAVSTPRAISFVNDSGSWYGFTYNSSLSQLYRIDFLNGIDQAPTGISSVSYSTPSGVISSSTWSRIKFIQQNGIWYGFCATAGNVLARLTFSGGLDGSFVDFETFTNSNGLFLNNAQDIGLITSNDTTYLLVINRLSSMLNVYELADSATSIPVLVVGHSLAGFSGPNGFDIKYDCGEYFGIFNSLSDGKVGVFNFGSHILNTPILTEVNFSGSFANPIKSYLFKERNQWVGFVKHGVSPSLSKIYFGDSLTGTPDSIVQFQSLNSSIAGWAFQIIEDSSRVFGFGIVSGNKNFYRLNFNESISFPENYVAIGNQVNYSFDHPGEYIVKAVVTDSANRVFRVFDTISVAESPSGDVALLQGTCESDSFKFVFVRDTTKAQIDAYSWNLNSASYADSSFSVQLLNADTFDLTAQVISPTGCTFEIDTAVIVHPRPELEILSDSTCRTQTILLSNNSIIAFDSITSFRWIFDTSDTLFGVLPSYAFLDTGNQGVVIQAVSNFGCSSDTSINVYIKDGPQAAFSVSQTCLNDQTALVSNPSSSIPYSVSWDLGDGNTSALEVFTHQYADTGLYDVQLIVNGVNGCSDTSSIPVSITQQSLAQIDSLSVVRCELQTLFGIGTSLPASVSSSSFWVVDSMIVSIDDTLLFLPDSTGNFDLKYIVNSGYSCFDTISQQVQVLSKPSLNLSLDERCVGDSVLLTANPGFFESQVLSLQHWTSGSQSSNDGVFALSSLEIGLVDVFYSVISDKGCFADTVFNIRFYERPTISLALIEPTLCTNLEYSIEFTYDLDSLDSLSNDSLIVNYTSSNTQTFFEPYTSVSFAEDGLVQLVMGLETAKHCKVLDTIQVYVSQSPDNHIESDTTCVNSIVQFSDLYDGSNYFRLWDLGNGNLSNQIAPQATYLDTGVFDVSVQITDLTTGCFDLDSAMVKVFPSPQIQISDSAFCEDQIVDIEAVEANGVGIRSMDWFLDGSLIARDSSVTFKMGSSGVYNLNVLGRFNHDCSSEFSQKLVVFPNPELSYDLTPMFGVPPSEVTARIKSEGDSMSITIGEQQFLDTSYAVFLVETASNLQVVLYLEDTNNCYSEAVRNLNFNDAFLDLAILNSQSSNNDDVVEVSLVYANTGNVPIERSVIQLKIGAEHILIDTIDGLIAPSEQRLYSFPAVRSSNKNYCVEIDAVSVLSDFDLSSNQLCRLDEGRFDVYSFYPNPSLKLSHARLEVINTNCDLLKCKLFAASGNLVSEFEREVTDQNFISFDIELDLVTAGVYFLQVFAPKF
jgi:PKD repeat protein